MTQKTHIRRGRRLVLAAAIAVCGALACAKRTEPDAAPAGIGEGKNMTERVKREGGRVWIDGVQDIKMTDNMRLRGMEMLLRHRGESTSLDDLRVYSGQAFHLCHGTKWELRTGLNTCVNPWDAAAKAYGYACRWTEPSRFHALQGLGKDGAWKKSEAFLERLWAAIDAGRPVLLGGCYGQCDTWRVVVGYDRENKSICYMGGEEPYEWTDLVDEKVEEFGFWDSQVVGPIDARKFGYGGWLANAAFLLGEKQAERSDKEKAVIALKRAVQMFRPGVTGGWDGGKTTHWFGEQAYEAAARDLAELDFPADLEKPRGGEWYDMNTIDGQLESIVTGRAAAADFCEGAAALLPDAKDGLLAAAKNYREEVEIAQGTFPQFPWKMTEDEREAWLSEKPNCEAAADAFRRMLEKERAAVGEIERGLSAIGAEGRWPAMLLESTVALFRNGKDWNREPDTVAGPGPHSYLLMHFLQMRAAGWEDIDLDDVAVLSGASALYAYEHGAFEPKYAYRRNRPDERIAEATGFGYEWVGFESPEGAWELIKASIDSGRPVKGEHAENVLFAGYEDAVEPEHRKVFAISDEPDTFSKWWTWEEFAKWAARVKGWGLPRLGQHTERTTAADSKTTALRVMRDLVEWSAEPPAACRKAYPKATFGLAGIEKYAADCANFEKYPDFGMCHDMNCQWAVRKSTAAHLKRLVEKGVFSDGVNERLRAAAKDYGAAFDGWVVAFNNIGWGGPKDGGKLRKNRLAAADALAEALKHERAAVAELDRAVAAAAEDEIAEMKRDKANEFLTDHRGFHTFGELGEYSRSIEIRKGLAMAAKFKGTDVGAEALMTAARLHSGACGDERGPTEGGWDRMIELNQRVVDEYPGTRQAEQARWWIAVYHGCWAPHYCCHFTQGKMDWPKAIRLYRDIYEKAGKPGCRRAALARIAEIQCARTGEWREGLVAWRQFREGSAEAPGCPYENGRGCGRAMGLDHFLLNFSYGPALDRTKSADEAIKLRREFVDLAPKMESFRTASLSGLEKRLRSLGQDERAEKVRAQLNLCETWIAVGPFSGNDELMGRDLKISDMPVDLIAFAKSNGSWWDESCPESLAKEVLTAYGPERDYAAGSVDLEKVYRVVPVFEAEGERRDEREGKKLKRRREGRAMWARTSTIAPSAFLEATGTVYALTNVDSPRAQTGQLRVGACGGAKAWLNGRHVFTADVLHDYSTMDQFIRPVELNAGQNQLFVKFTPYGGGEPVHVRITGEDGIALPGVTYSVPDVPPENKFRSEFVRLGKEDLPSRSLAIASTNTPPIVDGRLDDAVWKRKPDIEGLMPSDGRGMVSAPTVAWLAWDDTNLYVAVRCDEPNPRGMQLNAKNRDGSVWNDDSVELFLDMKLNRKTYYQIIVSAANVVYDGYERRADWNGDFASATGREKDAWTCEIAIPWKTLGQEGPPRGKKIGFNLLRNRIQAGPEYQQWAPTFGSAHRPEFFGTVGFRP